MRVLVTGASGFLGRHVVSTAIRNGHAVRAQVRPASASIPDEWYDHPALEVAKYDLRWEDLVPLVEGVDTVIHLAAAKSGPMHEQFASNVIGTENLLEAMNATAVNRIICVSTFSVYEYLQKRRWSVLDESTPLAFHSTDRDAYCQTKLIQECTIRQFASERDWECVVLRPGVVFGRDHLWTARIGFQINNKWWIRIGASSLLPLTYVVNCAEAITLAASYKHAEREIVLNILDDDLPSIRTYLKALQVRLSARPHVIPIPWQSACSLAMLVSFANNTMCRGRIKVPGMLTPSQLHARCKPLRYSNNAIKATLGWRPRISWREGLERSCKGLDSAALPVGQAVNAVTATSTVPQVL